ncbi:ArsR family transcriptional regulator [Mesorhizobium sp. Root552]|uniref:ArsR/SmtB family transcription factor n=1 Tax=Mesorhizobium sp. Root552 TaxID=1736555 RepID=UPI0006FCF483|nr:metalloregulator ArsR/SmtB family transcription factor [Mesorhizobium sp. Root552]KQZ33039.1 ArsR family transcriptional regulator [Mesorhizobium sp. Root552]
MNMSLLDDTTHSAAADAAALAAKLAALAHPARIEILRHLAAHRSCCCGQVVERLDLAQSTVSQHLKILVAVGLVRFEADGQRSRYAVNREQLAAISGALATFTKSCC